MRISGDSNDGKMGEMVSGVLAKLRVKEGLGHLFFVKIEKNGKPTVFDKEEDGIIDWSEARQAIIFFFGKDYTFCIIRHITENYRVHKQFIGRGGWRICMDDWLLPMEMCLCKNSECYSRRRISGREFIQEFIFMYGDYCGLIKKRKRIQRDK